MSDERTANYADLRDKDICCSKCGVLFCWYEDDFLASVCSVCQEKCATRAKINSIITKLAALAAENAALRERLASLTNVCVEAASAAGESWLAQQLKLADAIDKYGTPTQSRPVAAGEE